MQGVAKCSSDQDVSVSALHLAVQGSREGVMKMLLRHRFVNVNSKDKDGLSPLMKAAKRGDAKIVQLLLENWVDTRPVDPNGDSALMIAIDNGDKETLRLLAKHVENLVPKNMVSARPPSATSLDLYIEESARRSETCMDEKFLEETDS